MFADYISSFADSVVGLQRLINEIEKFCKSVRIEINFNEIKIIVFRNGGPLKQIEKWFYDGMNLDIVSFYKYLGLFFRPKLIWSKTQESQGLKAAETIF